MLKLNTKTIVFIAGAALLAGASVWGNNVRREISAGKEVKQMTAKMETYCVGRYLIDLPQDTIVNYGATRIFNVYVAFLEPNFKQPPFSKRLKAREEELKAEKNRAGMPSLEKAQDVSNAQLKGRLFQYGRTNTTLTGDDGKPFVAVSDEAQVWLHGPVYEEYRLETDMIDAEQTDDIVQLARRIRPLAPMQIPTEPGFCFERGIILDPPGPAPDQVESIVLHFKLKKFPDVVGNFSIGTNGDKVDESLLVRDKKASLGPKYDSLFTPIFKGDRTINGIVGQEASEKVKELNGTSAHSFMWDTVGKPNDIFAPSVSLDISTGYGQPGNPLNSSLPDKAAIELWKKISNSIRLRPTTPGKISDADEPNNPNPATPNRLPLGTKVSSLRACPETGVYECPPAAPGVTDRRVYLEQGRPMPSAFVIAPKPGIAGFFGGRESKDVETAWTLVAYEEDA